MNNLSFPPTQFIAPQIINNDFKIQKSGEDILKNLQRRLDVSAPEFFTNHQLSKIIRRIRYHQEIAKFQRFLQERAISPVEFDVVYISVGHAEVPEQIWPGFIFEALQDGKKVETCLIENQRKYVDQNSTHLRSEYELYLKATPDEEAIRKFDSFSVQQFLCGFPDSSWEDNFYEDSMNDNRKQAYPYLSNIFWKNREQTMNVLDNFSRYIENILSQGKKVVLGYHCDPSFEDLRTIFNEKVEKYPDQISFLWGYWGVNLMTHQHFEKKDVKMENPSGPWTYHAKLSTTTLH
jgi:hypothetical protein